MGLRLEVGQRKSDAEGKKKEPALKPSGNLFSAQHLESR